jgi:predicted MFS family arabinose efflux permease
MSVQVFHVDARGFGVLSSVMAVGTLAGALLSARSDRPGLPTLLWAAALLGIGFTLAAVAPGYWSFAAALVVVGIAYLTFVNATNGMMQLSTEPAMRGRIMALRVGVALGCTPIGAPIVGWVADDVGPRWALAVAAASGFVAACVAAFALMRNGVAQGKESSSFFKKRTKNLVPRGGVPIVPATSPNK